MCQKDITGNLKRLQNSDWAVERSNIVMYSYVFKLQVKGFYSYEL